MAKRTLEVVITGDEKGGKAALDNMGTSADEFATKWDDVGKKMASAGAKMSLGITLPAIALGAVAINAASDQAESLSKSNTIFEQNGAAIEKWASGAARDFGQSKQSALENAASFGNMFRQLDIGVAPATKMSKAMVELASDFASFHNADISEVLLAQQAAFRGEYDALQRFVPTINAAAVQQKAMAMTGKENADQLTDTEKALATYQLMLEGAGKAQGDFDRTSGGAANQQRILKAEFQDTAAKLGTLLLPAFTSLLHVGSDVLGFLSDLPTGVQSGGLAFVALAAGIGPVLTITGNLIRVGAQVPKVFDAISAGADTVALKSLYAAEGLKAMSMSSLLMGGAATLGIGALAGLWLAFQAGDGPYEKITAAANKWADAQIREARTAGDSRAQLTALTSTQDVLKAKMAELHEVQDQLSKGYAANGVTVDELNVRNRATAESLLGLQTRHDDLLPRIKELRQQVREAEAAEKARAESIAAVVSGTESMTTTTQDAVNAIRSLRDEQFGATNADIAWKQSLFDVTKAQDDYNAAVAEFGPESAQAQQAHLALESAQNRSAQAGIAATDSQADLIRKYQEQPGALEAAIAGLRNEIAVHGDASGVIQDQINKLQGLGFNLSLLNGASAKIHVYAETGEAEAALSRVRAGAASLNDYAFAAVHPFGYSEGGWVGGVGNGDTVPAMLTPGEFVLSKDMLAGAAGVPAGVGARAGVGNSYSILVQVAPTADLSRVGAEVIEAIKAYERQNGNVWEPA